MSYILDALKKSEMQARQGELPSIHSSHTGSAQSHRPGWLYALSGGAAAAVLFTAAYLLLPGADETTAPVVAQSPTPTSTAAAQTAQAVAARPIASSPSTPAAIQPVALQPMTSQPASPPANEPVQTVAMQPTNTQPVYQQPTAEPSTQAPAPEAIPMPDIRPQTEAAAPSIPLLSQLPVAVQESLPPIDVSGHIYDARPAARMVFINGNIHREGDMLAANLQLLGITPNGVELSFRNTAFRIELFAMPEQSGN